MYRALDSNIDQYGIYSQPDLQGIRQQWIFQGLSSNPAIRGYFEAYVQDHQMRMEQFQFVQPTRRVRP